MNASHRIISQGAKRGLSRPPSSRPAVRFLSTSSEAGSGRLVISRRLWQTYSHQLKPPEKVVPKTPEEVKPWPKSWIRFFVVSGSIVVPYMTLWLVSSNETLRNQLLPIDDDSSEFMKRIRRHYGKEDPSSASYYDIRSQIAEVDYVLLGEASAAKRAQERRIQERIGQDVAVNVGFVTDGAGTGPPLCTEMKRHSLPGSTKVDPEVITELVKESRTEDALGVLTGSPVVQTASEEEEEGLDFGSQTNLLDEQEKLVDYDSLFDSHYSMSTWQVVDPSMIPGAQTPKASPTSSNQFEKERLQYEIAQLEQELRNGGTRPVDDVMDDIRRRKKELRSLSWRRFVPF